MYRKKRSALWYETIRGEGSESTYLRQTMAERDDHDPNDPLQDFIDYEEHRYDPGYWPTEWTRKGRFLPIFAVMRREHLSSLYRALLTTVVLGQISLYVLLNLDDSLLYAWLWYGAALVFVFFGLWYFIHRSMVPTSSRPASEDIRHVHHGKHREHT
jgi:hypothetical protein